MIDLHLHSRFSDGTLTPTELVERAVQKDVTAISLTDHDTMAGNEEAVRAGLAHGIKVLPGVEFSVLMGENTVHLLGYGVEPDEDANGEVLQRLKKGREERLGVMVAKLNDLGINIGSADVRREAGGEIIGRLHIARVLARKRFVGSVKEAFTRYLGRGAAAYAERPKLTPEEAVRLVHSMGGVAVLAHPGTMERESPELLNKALDILAPLGLDGLECHYTSHTAEQTARYAGLARGMDLLVTGGSDFHKPDPDGPEIGSGSGRLRVPPEAFTALEMAIAARRAEKRAGAPL